MRFPCTISQQSGGEWLVRHVGRDVGCVEVTAPTRVQALEKMRGELQYRLEICACTGEMSQHVQIEITDQPGR